MQHKKKTKTLSGSSYLGTDLFVTLFVCIRQYL